MPTLLERLLSPLSRAESVRTWPPESLREHWEKVEDYRRRYENDRDARLPYATEFSGSTYGRKIYTPIAVAREVCNFSAEMLFSAPPSITYEQDEKLLEDVLEANGLDSALIDMAAKIAAEGRGGLRVYYDSEVNDQETPLIDHVHEDEVIWNQRGRFTVGGVVILERQPVTTTGLSADVYRLVEEHVRGGVIRKLYKGTGASLGNEVALDTLDEFSGLPEEEDTGLDAPTLIRWDNVPGGHSDLAGALSVLDAIDAEVSYGREKSEKSRPVSFADASLFDDKGRVDLSGIIAVRRGPANLTRAMGEEPARMVETVQPAFLAAETIAWIDFLIDTCLLTMGYSKASYGRDEGGSADSGKALRLRQARTLLKKAGKDRMAVEAIRTAIATALAWHARASDVKEYRPEIELGDGLPRDSVEDAQEANTWGDAMSLEEKVRMRRPDWDDEAVAEEVARIEGEKSAGLAGAGEPGADALDRTRQLLDGLGRNGEQDENEPPGGRRR